MEALYPMLHTIVTNLTMFLLYLMKFSLVFFVTFDDLSVIVFLGNDLRRFLCPCCMEEKSY